MANKSFPPSATLSPGVYMIETDLSYVTTDQSFHRAGLVGFASKGPINIPTRVRSRRELNTIFGYPHPESSDPYLIYAAQQYLNVATELFVVRVGDSDIVSNESAKTATIDVPSAGGQVIISGSVSETFSFDDDAFFRFKVNGIEASKVLVVFSDDKRMAPLTNTPYTCLQLVEDLNAQLVPGIDGIEFFCTSGNRVGVRTTLAYGPDAELELLSIQNALYGPNSVIGLGTGMTEAVVTANNDRYPNDGYHSAGSWDFTGLTDLNLILVIDGTTNVLIDNVPQVIDLSSLEGTISSTTDVVNAINAAIGLGDVPGGYEAFATGDNISIRTLHHGRTAKLLVKSESTTFDLFGFDLNTASGESPAGVSGDAAISTFGIVNGDQNLNGDVCFTLLADTPGIDGNNTEVRITNDLAEGLFSVEVFNNGVPIEQFGGLTKDTSARKYIESYLTGFSDFIRVNDNTDNPAPPLDGIYKLSGGTDGIPADADKQDELIIGNQLASTGLYALSDPELVSIDLLAVPGHPSTAVTLAMLDIAENLRGDCLAIIDAPFGLSVREVVQWQNGVHPLNQVRFDSDFGALYWPWIKIRDSYNAVEVWVPPSGAIMAVIARSDALSQPWFAPAGPNRGVLLDALDVFTRPTIDERHDMYGNRNAVNPIVQFSDIDGFVVWGQKTLQRTPTALDRVNVRRLMFVVESRIRTASKFLLFDPNDDEFRRKFISIARGILDELKINRGVFDYIIKADAELNTPDVIDRNEFRAQIGIQPVRAVEFIFIEFSLHRTGSFQENADNF